MANYTRLTNLDVTGRLAIGGVDVGATPAQLDRGALKVKTGALAAVDTGGGVLSVQFGKASLIEYVQIIVTTKTSGACTIDVGVTSTSATTSADNLLDGKDISAAAGTFDNIVGAGTNGKSKYLCPAGKWVTASKDSGETAGLVGTYAIYYREL